MTKFRHGRRTLRRLNVNVLQSSQSLSTFECPVGASGLKELLKVSDSNANAVGTKIKLRRRQNWKYLSKQTISVEFLGRFTSVFVVLYCIFPVSLASSWICIDSPRAVVPSPRRPSIANFMTHNYHSEKVASFIF